MLLNFANTLQAQSQNWWKVDGNTNGSSTSFLGTTNNQPLIFKTNNTTRIQLPASGGVIFNHLINTGTGLLKFDASGNIVPFNFSADSTKVLYADGTWRNINFTNSGWTTSGNNLYNTTKNIGIGTNAPQYKLDVNGNARVTGTLYAGNIMITDKVQTDTANIGVITLPSYNTIIGDPHITGNTQVTGNGTYTGNVGIGVTNPTVKLDVNGSIKTNGNITANSLTVNGVTSFTNKVEAFRITPLPGDSLIRFGDSTIYFNTSYNAINWLSKVFANTNYRGLGIGNGARGIGTNSVAIGSSAFTVGDYSYVIGRNVRTSTQSSHNIVFGTGATGNQISPLVNDISHSLMVGFNSTVPTFFVGPSNGAGTTGNVGIGTTAPQGKLQIGDGISKITMGDAYTGNPYFLTNYIGFNVGRVNGQWQTGNDTYSNGGTVLIGDVTGGLRIVTFPTTSNGQDQNFSDTQLNSYNSLRIYPNGQIQIGELKPVAPNPHPNFKLSVDGKIVAKEIYVNIQYWFDTVFSSSYKRMNWQEKENYFTTYNHLPNIAPQDSVLKYGVDVAGTMAGILQNTEENSLDIVEIYKLLLKQQAEINALKNKNANLEQQIILLKDN